MDDKQIKSDTSEEQVISDPVGSDDQQVSDSATPVDQTSDLSDNIDIPTPDEPSSSAEASDDKPNVSETSIVEAESAGSAEDAAEVFEDAPAEASASSDQDTATDDIAEESANSEKSSDVILGSEATPESNADAGQASMTENDEAANAEAGLADTADQNPNAKWYVVHTFSGHENKVATNLRQRIDSEHLENKIVDILVPTQDKIEIRGGKKEQVKEKIFPGYILVKMDLDDASWLAVRTTQGVTAFVGMNNKPTPISQREVSSIVKFMTQGAPATFKDVFMVDDTVRIVDGPFTDFIGKVESVDKEKGKVRVLVSIFGRETPVELDFLQVTKL